MKKSKKRSILVGMLTSVVSTFLLSSACNVQVNKVEVKIEDKIIDKAYSLKDDPLVKKIQSINTTTMTQLQFYGASGFIENLYGKISPRRFLATFGIEGLSIPNNYIVKAHKDAFSDKIIYKVSKDKMHIVVEQKISNFASPKEYGLKTKNNIEDYEKTLNIMYNVFDQIHETNLSELEFRLLTDFVSTGTWVKTFDTTNTGVLKNITNKYKIIFPVDVISQLNQVAGFKQMEVQKTVDSDALEFHLKFRLNDNAPTYNIKKMVKIDSFLGTDDTSTDAAVLDNTVKLVNLAAKNIKSKLPYYDFHKVSEPRKNFNEFFNVFGNSKEESLATKYKISLPKTLFEYLKKLNNEDIDGRKYKVDFTVVDFGQDVSQLVIRVAAENGTEKKIIVKLSLRFQRYKKFLNINFKNVFNRAALSEDYDLIVLFGIYGRYTLISSVTGHIYPGWPYQQKKLQAWPTDGYTVYGSILDPYDSSIIFSGGGLFNNEEYMRIMAIKPFYHADDRGWIYQKTILIPPVGHKEGLRPIFTNLVPTTDKNIYNVILYMYNQSQAKNVKAYTMKFDWTQSKFIGSPMAFPEISNSNLFRIIGLKTRDVKDGYLIIVDEGGKSKIFLIDSKTLKLIKNTWAFPTFDFKIDYFTRVPIKYGGGYIVTGSSDGKTTKLVYVDEKGIIHKSTNPELSRVEGTHYKITINQHGIFLAGWLGKFVKFSFDHKTKEIKREWISHILNCTADSHQIIRKLISDSEGYMYAFTNAVGGKSVIVQKIKPDGSDSIW